MFSNIFKIILQHLNSSPIQYSTNVHGSDGHILNCIGQSIVLIFNCLNRSPLGVILCCSFSLQTACGKKNGKHLSKWFHPGLGSNTNLGSKVLDTFDASMFQICMTMFYNSRNCQCPGLILSSLFLSGQ